jgi:hypothetical protein
MIAPPLTPPWFDNEPKAINNMPMKIAANAMKNNHVAKENGAGAE